MLFFTLKIPTFFLDSFPLGLRTLSGHSEQTTTTTRPRLVLLHSLYFKMFPLCWWWGEPWVSRSGWMEANPGDQGEILFVIALCYRGALPRYPSQRPFLRNEDLPGHYAAAVTRF